MSDRAWQSTSSTDASLAGNYSGNTAPVTGDTVTLNSVGTANLTTNLGVYTNILGLTLAAYDSFTANVGSEATGTNAATYLATGTSGASTVYIGKPSGNSGNGSAMFLLDLSSGGGTVNVYKTGSKSGTYPPLCLKGTSVIINAYGGEAGFAVRPGETGTLTGLSLISQDGQSSPVFRCGTGTTFPSTVRVESGVLYTDSTHAITTLKVTGSDASVITNEGATGAVTNVDLANGAKFIHKGTGAVTAASVRANCTFDYGQSAASRTLDDVYANAGATILLDNGNAGSITHSAGGTNVPTIHCLDGIGTVTITAPVGMALNVR